MFESKVTITSQQHVNGKCTFAELNLGAYFIDLDTDPDILWIRLRSRVKASVSGSLAANWNCVRAKDGLFGFKDENTPVQVRDVLISHAARE